MKNDLEVYKYNNVQNINIVIGAAIQRHNNINFNFGNALPSNYPNSIQANTLRINQIYSKTEINTLKDKKQEEEIKPKVEMQNSEQESEKILAEHIRKYKKSTRKRKN